MTYEQFVKNEPNKDSVTGIKIENGEFYFLMWMENAEHYSIQKAMSSDGYKMNTSPISESGDMYSAVQSVAEYNSMYILYEKDDSGNLVNKEDAVYVNSHDYFGYAMYAKPEKLTVLEVSKTELQAIFNSLKDGLYIMIVNK